MGTISGLFRAMLKRLRWPAGRQSAEPGQLAFAAISVDPGLLARLPRDQARRLGAHGEAYATSLLKDGLLREGAQAGARDRATLVLRSVRQFALRDAVLGGSTDDMVASALTGAGDGLGALLTSLETEPRPSEAATTLAGDALAALGVDGMQRLGRARGEVLLTAACRDAARLLREGAAPVEARVRLIETVCAQWRVLPLMASPHGTSRQWADHLVELWRDARLCAQWREPERRRLWEDARDGHAFGAVWLMPSILSALVRTEAECLARDARSAAAFVLRHRDARGGARDGVRAAVEAARTVIVSCDVGGDNLAALVPRPAIERDFDEAPVRPSAIAARVARA